MLLHQVFPGAGKWGYAVAGVSNFDVTYTAPTNQPYGGKWAGVPTSGGSAVTLADKALLRPLEKQQLYGTWPQLMKLNQLALTKIQLHILLLQNSVV